MAEYWKSQPKKFCDFCKCWITDNKPSVDFHEKGKRHQENVRNKIDELKKKGIEDARKKDKENDYMRRMEEAALEAFKKDLANDPELAKRHNIRLPADKEAVYEGPQLPPEGYVPQKEEEPDELGGVAKEDDTTQGEWYEAVSDQGYTYYWNTVSGESIWEAPSKYVSLADQGLAPADKDAAAETKIKKTEAPAEPVSVEEIPLPPGVEEIPLPGEESRSASEPPEEESDSEEEVEGKQDRSSRGVFGTWSRVQKETEAQQIDLELPKPKEEVIFTPIPVATEEPRLKFKEKQITSLGASKSGPVAFKKRKLGNNSKNVRKRNDDD